MDRIISPAVLAAVVLHAPTLPAAQAGQIGAPYQVDGLQVSSDPIGGVGTEMIIIGLGRAPDLVSPDAGIPLPPAAEHEWMTLLGTEGSAPVSRVRIERRCEFLCGYEALGDSEECHWVGLYFPQGAIDIGGVVAAVPGRLELVEYTPLASVPAASPEADPLADLAAGNEPLELLWDGYGGEMAMRVEAWDPATGRLTGSLGTPYGEDQPLEAADCRAGAYEWLLAIECESFAVLASGGAPLLVSLADYGMPAVEPIARFEHGGSRHYVVRFGAKAQDVVGLVSAEPAGWRARFRPRDWAQLC